MEPVCCHEADYSVLYKNSDPRSRPGMTVLYFQIDDFIIKILAPLFEEVEDEAEAF